MAVGVMSMKYGKFSIKIIKIHNNWKYFQYKTGFSLDSSTRIVYHRLALHGGAIEVIALDLNSLNTLERHIHETLRSQKDLSEQLRITQAADLCRCSVSKISKFVKKLGFRNYKQYLDFLAGKPIEGMGTTAELQRVQNFLEAFDSSLVDELHTLILNHSKVILFGYGPSFLCAQYFEYRFRNCSDKVTMAVSDEISAMNMVDDSTLLIIITETGRFHSFQDIYRHAKEKGCEVVILVEEFNDRLLDQCDHIFWLSSSLQPQHLQPYEKSRTLFFIFLEEIVQRFLSGQLQQ